MVTRRNNKQPKKQIVLRFLSLLIIIFGFWTIIIAQIQESDRPVAVIVSDQAMEQVVRRILVWHFKPRSKPTVIYLAEEGIRKSWLPEIKNIEFQLLSDEEIQQKDLKLYFFTEPNFWRNSYNVGFAFGDPHCVFTGANWRFRISKQRVKLWQKYGVGGGCGSDS